MFPFSINNTLKLFANNNNNSTEPIDEEAIKERISQAVSQSLPNKRNVKFNAIVVLECDNDQKRTIVINETLNNNSNNNNNNNNNSGQKMQLTATFPTNTFTAISTSDMTNTTNVLLSQQPLFPATVEGLQAILNLTSSSISRPNMSEGVLQNSFSFIPMIAENFNEPNIKAEKSTDNNESGYSSRKRKSEKPCRIPQDSLADSNGLDLTMCIKNDDEPKSERYFHTNNVPIWPCPVSMDGKNVLPNQQMVLPRIKRAPQLPGHKKSSKVFNCNQCKLQFNSLNALCKHTFSDHRAFRCTFCSANFTQRSNLQRHSLKHVGFKPFICNVCSKAYYRKDHLVRHIEVSHPGSDPKSNITVKLSSSECLEYLEKMQNDQITAMEEANGFFNIAVKDSPISENGDIGEVSPVTMAPYDDTRETSPLNEDSDSPDKLHISFENSFVKDECRMEDVVEYNHCMLSEGASVE